MILDGLATMLKIGSRFRFTNGLFGGGNMLICKLTFKLGARDEVKLGIVLRLGLRVGLGVLVINGDNREFVPNDVSNKIYIVWKHVSSFGKSEDGTRVVSSFISLDLPMLHVILLKNGLTQVIFLSNNCLLYFLVTTLSSLVILLVAFVTDAI